jgi:CHAT domain-containing protein
MKLQKFLRLAGLVQALWALYACNTTPVTEPPSRKMRAGEYYQLGLQQLDSAKFNASLISLSTALSAYEEEKNVYGSILSLRQIATVQAELGELPRASENISKAMLLQGAYANDSLLLLASLQLTAGSIFQKKNQLAQADSLYTRALSIRRRQLGDDHPAIAELYRHQGRVAFVKGDYVTSLSLANRAYAINKKHLSAFHPEQAYLHSLLGAIYDQKADYDRAKMHYDSCLVINQRVHGPNHPETGKVYVNLGNLYNMRGSILKARENFTAALKILRGAYGEKHSTVASVYNNMAVLDVEGGDADKAILYYKNAADIFAEKLGPDNMQVAICYGNIAAAHLRMKRPDAALESLQKSLAIRRRNAPEDHPIFGPSYITLSAVYNAKNDLDSAIYFANKAATIYTRQNISVHPVLAEAYFAMAEVFGKQKQLEKSLAQLRKVETIFLETNGRESIKLAQAYNRMAMAHYDLDRLDSSMHYYQKAAAVIAPNLSASSVADPASHRLIRSPIYLIWSLHGKARTFTKLYYSSRGWNLNHLFQALDTYKMVCILMERTVGSFTDKEAKLYLLETANAIYTDAMEVAFALYRKTNDEAYINEAFAFSEKNKNVLLLEFLKQAHARNTAGLPDSLAQAEELVQADIHFYEKQLFDETLKPDTLRDSGKIRLWQAALTERKKKQSELNTTLEENFAEYYRLKYRTPVASVANVQSRLTASQVLLEYFVSDSALYLFTISQNRQHFFRLEKRPDMETQVAGLREALLANDFPKYIQHAQNLYATLLPEAAVKILSAYRNWIVVPDGALGYIPFDLLLPPGADIRSGDYLHLPYLVRNHQISYDYSATFAYANDQRQATQRHNGKMLGFAPKFTQPGFPAPPASLVAYKDVVRGGFDNLKGARTELAAISSIFSGQYFNNQQATERNFKDNVGSNGIIHLATHAVIDDDNPAYSHLVFEMDPADELEDGRLFSYEIYNLRLQAELVTLSACNTGFGKISKGEGIMSLARGFAYAGCPNIVMSLWPAPDQATAFIMERFYKALAGGVSKEEALHQAKLSYLQESDLNTANPYFWGSFVFIGEPGPLTVQSPGRPGFRLMLISIAGIATIFVAGTFWWYRRRRYAATA